LNIVGYAKIFEGLLDNGVVVMGGYVGHSDLHKPQGF